MTAADDMVHTLFNELINNNWTFNGHEPTEVNINEEDLEIQVHLADGWMVKVKIEEMMAPNQRVCGSCGELRGGWPDEWRNIGGRALIYACADCVAKQEKPDGGQLPTVQ